LTPAQNGSTSVVLARGEIAVLQLEYPEDIYTHYFLHPEVGAVPLGSTVHGCGAGSGAPIVIDME
jgi:hypothetical protein